MFLWKQTVRRAGGDLFLEFLALLAEKQLCRDVDVEVTVVLICLCKYLHRIALAKYTSVSFAARRKPVSQS